MMTSTAQAVKVSGNVTRNLVAAAEKYLDAVVVGVLAVLALMFFVAAVTGNFSLVLISASGLLSLAFAASIISAVQRDKESQNNE